MLVQGLDDNGDAALTSSSQIGRSVMLPFWENLEKDMIVRLREVTIEDLCRQVEKAVDTGESGQPRSIEFNI